MFPLYIIYTMTRIFPNEWRILTGTKQVTQRSYIHYRFNQ